MRTIELDTFEQKDLINYLEKLKVLLNEKNDSEHHDNQRWTNINYDNMRIDHLIGLVNGTIVHEEYYRQSKNAPFLDNRGKKNEQEEKKDIFTMLEDLI